MTQVVVEIAGKSYTGRITTGGLIMAEKDLGKPVIQALKDSPGLATVYMVMRYALHPMDAPSQYISKAEWDEILASDDVVGFTTACTRIMELLAASGGKNRETHAKN